MSGFAQTPYSRPDVLKTRNCSHAQVNIDQLQELWEKAAVKPAFVQNRCFAKQGWDITVRQFCKANGIVYQGFSLLTANPEALRDERVIQIASRMHATPQQVIFRFAQQVSYLSHPYFFFFFNFFIHIYPSATR